MTETTSTSSSTPRLTRNLISLLGMAIVVASLASILFLFVAETLETKSNPYLGIFTYIVFPGFLIFGLFIVVLGALLERRRRRKLSSEEIGLYPRIDLNDPRRRRALVTFLGVTFLFIFVSAFGSYRAYEYTDSVAFCGQLCHVVMNPEFIAYQASPHARVRCVDCHVGPGAGWYVRSKLSGLYQVYSVLFEKYPKPIPTPVHDLRPAQQTCEQCHWPEKFFGAQLKVFNRYGYDEANTLRQIRMLINTGGGSPSTGLVAGIHWHMNIANEITYISNDNQRQEIPWVRMKDQAGNVTDFFADGTALTPEELSSAPKRRMDCVDCHNRPSHVYLSPDRAMNESFISGRLDVSLPYLKQQAVEALAKEYQSTPEAVGGIASSLDEFYRVNYPAVYEQKRASISGAIVEVQRVFQTYFFPEMKVDWQTHPENIGHYYSQGCFRCHDDRHQSPSGKVIRADCNICHTVLDQNDGGQPLKIANGAFVHPVDLGDMTGMKCADCHSGKGMKPQ